jgi:hypothetical protein
MRWDAGSAPVLDTQAAAINDWMNPATIGPADGRSAWFCTKKSVSAEVDWLEKKILNSPYDNTLQSFHPI